MKNIALIKLWSGKGYLLDEVEVEYNVNDSYDILELAFVKIIKEGLNVGSYKVDDGSIDEDDERYIYFDLTPYNLDCYYLLVENLVIDYVSRAIKWLQ